MREKLYQKFYSCQQLFIIFFLQVLLLRIKTFSIDKDRVLCYYLGSNFYLLLQVERGNTNNMEKNADTKKKAMKTLVVMGSDSDYNVMKDCLSTLKKFEIEYECVVCSAHRTPEKCSELAKNAKKNGFSCIIAAAGKAAHLPGVIAAFTTLPVIGVPIKSDALDGMDALLAIAQMPPGIPVATVAINGSTNAAVLAAQIMSVKSKELQNKLKEYKQELKDKVEKKNAQLQEVIKNG